MTIELLLLFLVAFAAGFADAIVGRGGLIQTPAGLISRSQYPVSTVIGTLKIPAFSGTAFASAQYARKVALNYNQLAAMTTVALVATFCGSKLLTMISNVFMKPYLLFILTGVLIYTYANNKFGNHSSRSHNSKTQWIIILLISLLLGFYDGFIGTGAGSFLIMVFISFLGFNFLKASAHAKFVNLAANLGSIAFFAISGKIIYSIAIPMAVCNGLGGILGARLAILKGNKFIRIFFLIVVSGTIIRFAYDVFFR